MGRDEHLPFHRANAHSAFRTAQHGCEFGNFAPLVGFAAGRNGLFNAVRDMIGENFLLRTSERRLHCRNLRYYVNAITIFFDHPSKAANLTFNSFESLERRRLDVLAHSSYIPLPGIRFKSA